MTDSSTRFDTAAGGDDEPIAGGSLRTRPTTRRGRHVLARYRIRTILTDVVAVVAGSAAALAVRIGQESVTGDLGFNVLAALLLALWMIALTGCGTYLERALGVGPDEYRRVLAAGVWVFVLTVTLTYLVDEEVSRAYLSTSLLLSLLLCLLGRWLGRLWLVRKRSSGHLLISSLIVGDEQHADEVVATLNSHRYAGYAAADRLDTAGGREIDGLLADIDAAAYAVDLGAVIIAAGDGVDDRLVRRIGRHLEGSEIDLLMTPDLAAIASPRRTFTPASGLR